MRVAVAVTVNNRERYIDSLLSSLIENDTEDFDLFLAVEPNFYSRHPVDFSYPGRIDIVKNSGQLGVLENPFQLLSRIFGHGYEAVLYLEEDLIISRDVTKLARWYIEHPHETAICLNLCNYNSNTSARPDVITEVFQHASTQEQGFNAMGLVILREKWESVFVDSWHDGGCGWDWAIMGWIRDHKAICIGPEASRTTHRVDAKHGTHYNRHEYGYLFKNLALYLGEPVTDFRYSFS